MTGITSLSPSLACLLVLLLGCAVALTYAIKAQVKLKAEKYRFIQCHAKQSSLHRILSEQENRIRDLTRENKQLEQTRHRFLRSISHDLSNSISVIKNHYMEWFQQVRLETDLLEKAIATESSIHKIEQLVQHAHIAELSSDLASHTKVEKSCTLMRVLTLLLRQLPQRDETPSPQLSYPNAVDYILPVEEQALLLYLSFYYNLVAEQVPSHCRLHWQVTEQQGELVLAINCETTLPSTFAIANPEKQPDYFLAAPLSKKLRAKIRFGEQLPAPGLMQLKVACFQKTTLRSNSDVDDFSPQVFFELFQEPVLNKPGPEITSPKCLILDPCPEIQMSLTQTLSSHFNCIGMFCLIAGMKKILEWQPDVLILEPIQGSENGFNLLQELAKSIDLQSLSIIVLTAQDTTKNRLKALQLDIQVFFKKPLDNAILLESARRLQRAKQCQTMRLEVQQNVSFQPSRDAIFLAQLNRLLETEIANPDFRFEDYFEQFSLSKRQFFRRVNNLTRCTPKQYLIQKRLELAKHLLARGCLIQDVTQRCGFKNTRALLKVYQAHFGEEPV